MNRIRGNLRLKVINVKSFVAFLLVLQIVLSPFSAQPQVKAESNLITEKITHEYAANTWAYNNVVNSPDGNLYLSHVKNRNEITIKTLELGNWKEITSVTSNATGDTGFNGESDTVVDGQENVHIAFLFEKGTWLDSLRGIKYGVFKNGSWTYETVEANTDPWGGKNIFTPSMALDTNGKVHIVYRYMSSSPRLDEIKYATNQSGSWTTRTIASGTNGKDEVSKPQIEIDQTNEIHITYVKEDNQNNRYDNYYYLHKNTNQPNFSPAEKIVDAIADQNSYTYTPFVVDPSGKISFSYYEGNKWSMDIGNETFTTYFQTYQSGLSERNVLITDTDNITYPVKVRNSGSKSILLMYTQSKNSPPTDIEFFAMVKEGSAWTTGPKEVIPSLINSNPSEITYDIDLNGNLMVAMLDNGLRKISYIHPTDEDFGVFIESRNARLSNLTLTEGAFEQAFTPLKTNYTSTVGYEIKTIHVTPTVADANAKVKVNGTDVASGSPAAIPLTVGSNPITVSVTAEDGTTVKNYTMTVTRQAPSTNSSLSNLTVSTGSLDPLFNPSIIQYKVIVPNGTDTIGLTPTLADAKATVTVNGTSVPSGQEMASIRLSPGINSIPVVVTAEDSTTTKTYTVDVQRNNIPAATDTTFSVDEGAQTGTTVGTLPASDSNGDPLTYSILSGNSNNVFEMNATTGEITVANSSLLDFETKQLYNLAIKVTDGLDSTTANVLINVHDLNDNSPIPVGFSSTINENLATGTSVGKVTTTDADAGSTFNYMITSGNNEGAFAIDANGEITVANATKLDYESVKSFILTVEVSDGTNTATTTVTINLDNLNDHTPDVNDAQFSVDENAAIGTLVGTVSGSDADGDSLHYGIISGNESGAFTINPITGEIIVIDSSKLDYETQTTFVLKVEASDTMVPNVLITPFEKMIAFNAAATNIATITINVNNLNDNIPELLGFTKNIDENTANGTSIGTVTAVDADAGTSFTYHITAGNTEGAFAIDPASGELTVVNAAKLDYESVKSFILTVEVSDGTHTTTSTVTINLRNLNDHTPTLEDEQFSVDENAANGTVIGTVVGSDTDGDLLNYGIVSGNESGTFTINSATGEIIVTDSTKLDYETQTTYVLKVKVSDTQGPNGFLSPYAAITAMFAFNAIEPDLATITINVNNLNDNSPIPQGFTKKIDENTANGTSVGTVTAVDADGDTNFTYRITAGNTEGAFALDPISGELKVANTSKLDYETVKDFTLTIQVSDGVNTAETITSINLNNVNDNTPIVEDAVFSVDENTANGTTVGTVEANDADRDSLVFSIVSGNESGEYTIDSTSGKIIVADTTKLDYETIKSFILTVKVSDGENTADATVTVNLKNRNDNLPVGKDAEFAVAENAENGTAVGTVEASDVDGDALHYSIVSGNESGAFTIDFTSGEIVVADTTKLDYETIKIFKLIVQVSDGTYTSDLAVTVNLTNLNDNSPVGKDAEFAVDENAENGTVVGTVEASDADGDNLNYLVIEGNDTGAFTMDSATGDITVADASQLDFETIQSFMLTVQVNDGTHSEEALVQIDLNNLNDHTPVASDVESTIDEEAINGTEIATVEASDADGDEVRFSIASGNDEGIFMINETTGKITLANASLLDASIKAVHTLTIHASDGKNTATVNVSVTILSSEATLSGLTSSNGELSPEFKPGTTRYTMNVKQDIDSIRLTPTATDSNATVKINGKLFTSGQTSEFLPLHFGNNSIAIEVMAQNGQKTTYTIMVTRLKAVVVTVPVVVGDMVTVSDVEVDALEPNGTLVMELTESLDKVTTVHFTAMQVDTLIARNAMIKIVKEDVQLLIPAVNFAKGEDLTITLDRLDKNSNQPPSSMKAKSSVYDFTIKQGNKVISQFDYAIEIGYPTSFKELKIYYWNVDKKEWQVVGGTFDSGMIKASTHHFSTFAAFDPNDLVVKKPSIELPDTATNMYNGLFAGLLLLILGGAMFLVQRVRKLDRTN
jgi:hypothetical protein